MKEYATKVRQKLSSLKKLELDEKNILPSGFKNLESLLTLTNLVKKSIGWDEKITGLEIAVDIDSVDDEKGTITLVVWVWFEHLGWSASGSTDTLQVDDLLKTSELETQSKNAQEAKEKLSNLESLVIKHKNILPSEFSDLDKETFEELKQKLGFKGERQDPRITVKVIDRDNVNGKLKIGVWIFTSDSNIELTKPDRVFEVDGFISKFDQEKRQFIIKELQDWMIAQIKENSELKDKSEKEIEDSIWNDLIHDPKLELPADWGWDVKAKRDDHNGQISIKITILRNGDLWCEVGHIEINLNTEKTKFSDLNHLSDLSLEQIWWTADARN